MIECSSENIYKRRSFKFQGGKKTKRLIIAAFIVVLFFLYYKYVVCSQIINIVSDTAYAYSSQSVNCAVSDSLSDGIQYSDLITIEKDGAGNITLLTTNAYKVNVISRAVTEKTRKLLEEKTEGGVPVPLLAFSGIKLLAGYGADIKLKYISVSSVECGFYGKFTAVGINQTLHSVFVSVKVYVNIEIPFNRAVKTFESDIMISESVLIGKVPDVYLNGTLYGR